MKKKYIVISIIGGILLTAVIVAGMTGLVPGLSSAMGTNDARDLDVEYTQVDYETGLAKLGQKIDASAGYGPDTRISYSPTPKRIDATLSPEEASALFGLNHAEKYPIKDAQIRVNDDGTVEMSARLDLKGYKGIDFDNAVYFKGTVEMTSPNHMEIDADVLEIGRIDVPAKKEKIIAAIEDELNNKMASTPGMSIESITFENGEVQIKGTIPESATRVRI